MYVTTLTLITKWIQRYIIINMSEPLEWNYKEERIYIFKKEYIINTNLILQQTILSPTFSHNVIVDTGTTKDFFMPNTPLINENNNYYTFSCSTTKWQIIKINTWMEYPNHRTTRRSNQISYIPTHHIWCIDLGSVTMRPLMHIHIHKYKCYHLQQTNGTSNKRTTEILNRITDNRYEKIIPW